MQRPQAYGNPESSGSGSGCSDLSALENETDTLGRAIIRHERDARRIQAVLNGSSRPFSRALPRASVSKRLQRLNAAEQQEAQLRHTSGTAVEVNDVEVVTSTTRSWGRKQRPERKWTRYERQGDTAQVARAAAGSDRRYMVEEEVDEDAIVPHRTAHTGDGRAGSFIGSSGEDTPPSMTRYRPLSEPSSLRHMNTTVLDNAPGDASPTGHTRYCATANTSPVVDTQSRSPRSNELRARPNRRTIDLRQDLVDDNKENLPASKSKPLHSDHQMPRSHGLRTMLGSESRPTHTRNDSMQLLKRLAKVSSKSPFQANQSHSGAATLESKAQDAVQSTDLPATPIVTGGWIETPKQEHQVNETALIKDEELQHDRPPRQSPNESIVTAEPVLAHDHDGMDLSRQAPAPQQPSDRDSAKLPSGNKIVQQHITTAQSIPKTPPSITTKSAMLGARSAGIPQRQPGRSSPSSRPVKHVSFDLNGRTICEHCGGGFANAWVALWIELRSKVYVRDQNALASVRLTWLGAALLAWLCWYILENTLCKWYCKSYYALQMKGYGAFPSAPTYPLVIPNIILHPFEPVWRPLARWLTELLSLVFHWTSGQGTTDFTEPARFLGRSSAAENGAVQATKTILSARWTETLTSAAVASSRRALESVIDAVDDMARLWDANGIL